MKSVYTENKRLTELLFTLLEKTKSTHFAMCARSWCITFTHGNYGKSDIAICELVGSPVKRTVLIYLGFTEYGAVVLGECFSFCKKIRTLKHEALLNEIKTELRKEQNNA